MRGGVGGGSDGGPVTVAGKVSGAGLVRRCGRRRLVAGGRWGGESEAGSGQRS